MVIRFIFLAVPIFLVLQYAFMHRFGEPYPALVMPGFAGSGGYVNGYVRIERPEVVFVCDDESIAVQPEEVSGEQTTEWRCTGHVVRVEPFDPAKGQLGIGVQFYCNEAARPEQARVPLGAVDRRLPELRSGEAR